MITRKTVAEELTQEFLTEMKERRVFDDNKKYILDIIFNNAKNIINFIIMCYYNNYNKYNI